MFPASAQCLRKRWTESHQFWGLTENVLWDAFDNTREWRPREFSLLHLFSFTKYIQNINFFVLLKWLRKVSTYVTKTLIKSEGEDAVALSLQRIERRRSSGKDSKKSEVLSGDVFCLLEGNGMSEDMVGNGRKEMKDKKELCLLA